MMLVKLTDLFGGDVWVNPYYIVCMIAKTHSTHLFVLASDASVCVKQTPEEIKKIIDSANGD